mgnify:CR=1 FL=1
MIIGVPAEVKNNENRIGLTPDSVKHLSGIGNEILVQDGAGTNIGFTNDLYINAGAKILKNAEEIYKSSEMIVKVKEPTPDEYRFLRSDLTLFTYLHLAGDPENAKKIIDTGVTGIAYETVTASDGSMPLLAPMSEIAGRLAVFEGAYHLKKTNLSFFLLDKHLYSFYPIYSLQLHCQNHTYHPHLQIILLYPYFFNK